MYESYNISNILPETTFIGGATYIMNFRIKESQESGSYLDLTGSSSEWRMTTYGEKNFNHIIKKESLSQIEVVDAYTRRVKLLSADTQNLSGKFIHQFILVDLEGTIHIPAQGNILIISQIQADNISA